VRAGLVHDSCNWQYSSLAIRNGIEKDGPAIHDTFFYLRNYILWENEMVKKTILFLLILVIGGCNGQLTNSEPKALEHELIVCGAEEVYIFDMTRADVTPPSKIWSWKAKESTGLSEEMKGRFQTTDDCKPVDGGEKILITSSGSGLALVERSSGKAIFSAIVPNAHSAEMLPGGRIVAASSVSSEGNRIMLFDPAVSDKAIYEDELQSAHGVVWDEQRQALWALGYDQLREYKLADWSSSTPSLKQVAVYLLPDTGGHELQPVPDTQYLVISTSRHVYYFDRDKKIFALHPELGNLAHVKSVSILPATKQTAFIQSEGGNWWSEKIHFLNPETPSIHIQDGILYKIRWNSRQN